VITKASPILPHATRKVEGQDGGGRQTFLGVACRVLCVSAQCPPTQHPCRQGVEKSDVTPPPSSSRTGTRVGKSKKKHLSQES